MANKQPTNKSTSKKSTSADTVKYDYTLNSMDSLDHVYSAINSNAEVHKSFDFSNVALFADNKDHLGNDDANFRHFHQMRMFIQIPEYLKKAQRLNNTNTLLLTANLPEKLSYTLGSNWETPLGSVLGGSGLNNLLMQFLYFLFLLLH